jgi:hypothetical protein
VGLNAMGWGGVRSEIQLMEVIGHFAEATIDGSVTEAEVHLTNTRNLFRQTKPPL